jgi:hypothetical protein
MVHTYGLAPVAEPHLQGNVPQIAEAAAVGAGESQLKSGELPHTSYTDCSVIA